MHSPSARALRHLDRYYIILVRTLKHLIPAKCAINITYIYIHIILYRQRSPVVRLGGLAPARPII